MTTEYVILVDENDQPIGSAEKLQAHQDGLCHRAFSVFIFRKKPRLELLLQQRAASKYHSPLLWTNTCCSHPRIDENILDAAKRRLKEEMGITTPLKSIGKFHYIAHFHNGLTENEIDHVLVGFIENESIHPNPNEVESFRWIGLDELKTELHAKPDRFTPWLEQALNVIIATHII